MTQYFAKKKIQEPGGFADDSSSQSHVCTINTHCTLLSETKGQQEREGNVKRDKIIREQSDEHTWFNKPVWAKLIWRSKQKYTINYQHFGISEVSYLRPTSTCKLVTACPCGEHLHGEKHWPVSRVCWFLGFYRNSFSGF